VIGWMNDIAQATLADALQHYRTYYIPNNAFVVAVGDFDSAALTEQISAAFGPISSGGTPPPVLAVEPPQHGTRRTELKREAQLPFVAMAHHVPNLRSADAGALEVLAATLSGGESARLHQELVYRLRLAREAGASYDYTSLDPSLFTVYAQPLPGQSAAGVESALDREIERARTTPPTPRELEKAKNGMEAQFVFAQDSLFYQAMLLGQYEVAGEWRRLDDLLIARGCRRRGEGGRTYLNRDNRTVGVLFRSAGEQTGRRRSGAARLIN
jgi:zinc protease